MRPAQAPDNLACITIDFRDLTGAAAGKQNIAIGIDVDGIHVGEIKTAAVKVDELKACSLRRGVSRKESVVKRLL